MATSELPDQTAREAREHLRLDAAALFARCQVEFYRVSGPGGQHRNKVSSGVRLTHGLTGLSVTATERRSQHENRAVALSRMREAIALAVRRPPPALVVWPEGVLVRNGRLRVNERNPALPEVIALALDALVEAGGRPAAAAKRLELTTSGLVRFLREHPQAWRQANHLRELRGMGPLKAPG